MNCGVCGGEVRGYSGVLYGRPIKDWKHRTVPPGTQPHRPVLGTPVDQATLDRLHRPEAPAEVDADLADRPPLVRARLATAEEAESSMSCQQILRLLDTYRWKLLEGGPWYFRAADDVQYLILKARRRDLGVIVSWRHRPRKGAWELECAYRVAQGLTGQVGSEQLKQWISARDERCPDCGRSSVVHGEECP